MPNRVRNFNQLPDGSTVELEVESDDSAWAATAQVLVTEEKERNFAFSATDKGPKSFPLAFPKVALGEWTVTFLDQAEVKLWTRTRRPDGTIHSSSSKTLSGSTGKQHHAFVVTSAE